MNVDELLGRLDRVKRNGNGWIARCPAHEDGNPSLAVAVRDDGGQVGVRAAVIARVEPRIILAKLDQVKALTAPSEAERPTPIAATKLSELSASSIPTATVIATITVPQLHPQQDAG